MVTKSVTTLSIAPHVEAEIISGNKFCTKCGSERKGTEKFCSQCGTPFDSVPSNNHIVINEEKNSSFKKYLPYIIGGCSGASDNRLFQAQRIQRVEVAHRL